MIRARFALVIFAWQQPDQSMAQPTSFAIYLALQTTMPLVVIVVMIQLPQPGRVVPRCLLVHTQTFCDYDFQDEDSFHTVAVYGIDTNCSGRPAFFIYISEAQAVLTFSTTLPMNVFRIFDWKIVACSNGNRLYPSPHLRSLCPGQATLANCASSLIGTPSSDLDPACPTTSPNDCDPECSTDVLSRPNECRHGTNYSYAYVLVDCSYFPPIRPVPPATSSAPVESSKPPTLLGDEGLGVGVIAVLAVSGFVVVLAACVLISVLLYRTRRKYNAAKGESTRETRVSVEQFADDVEYDRTEAKAALKRLLLVDDADSFPLKLNKPLDFDMEDSDFFLVLPTSEKYSLLAQPKKGRIAKGEELQVKFQILVHCTTKIRATVALARPGTGYIQIPLVMETMLSTRLDWDELEFEEEPIGDGAYGTVWRGQWRGTDVAIKRLKLVHFDSVAEQEFLREVELLNRMRHPNIVEFIGAIQLPEKLCIVTEFAEYGSFLSCLMTRETSAGFRVKGMYDCAKGMTFLHASSIIHRDLKPDNLLVVSLDEHSKVTVQITDFGTPRLTAGTPIYMAPEVMKQGTGQYTTAADVFSFAISLWQAWTRREPYDSMEQEWEIASFVASGERLDLPEDMPEPLADLVGRCWAHNPADRPAFEEIGGPLLTPGPLIGDILAEHFDVGRKWQRVESYRPKFQTVFIGNLTAELRDDLQMEEL